MQGVGIIVGSLIALAGLAALFSFGRYPSAFVLGAVLLGIGYKMVAWAWKSIERERHESEAVAREHDLNAHHAREADDEAAERRRARVHAEEHAKAHAKFGGAVERERIIERQVVVTRCQFCGELTPVDLTACAACGARLK